MLAARYRVKDFLLDHFVVDLVEFIEQGADGLAKPYLVVVGLDLVQRSQLLKDIRRVLDELVLLVVKVYSL